MSLAHLDDQLERNRATAAGVAANFNSYKERVNSDPGLSDEGKRDQIAVARETAATRMRELRANEEKMIADKRESLERSIYGTAGYIATDVISYRDAQDRADRIENQSDAHAAVERALTTRDDVLAQAVLRRSFEQGWDVAINAYSDKHPSASEWVHDLNQLIQFGNSMNAGFAQTAAYSLGFN